MKKKTFKLIFKYNSVSNFLITDFFVFAMKTVILQDTSIQLKVPFTVQIRLTRFVPNRKNNNIDHKND